MWEGGSTETRQCSPALLLLLRLLLESLGVEPQCSGEHATFYQLQGQGLYCSVPGLNMQGVGSVHVNACSEGKLLLLHFTCLVSSFQTQIPNQMLSLYLTFYKALFRIKALSTFSVS